VIVVGGGVAGLATASMLRRRGCCVSILERRASLGGRASSREREGFVLESGAHLVGARDRALHALIAEACLEDELLPLRPLRLGQVHAGRFCPIDPVGWRGVARIPGVRAYQAFRLRRFGRLLRRFEGLMDAENPERAVRLDDRSVADFARLYFGRSVLEQWVAPLLAADLQADPEEASRLLFWRHYVARQYTPVGSLRGPLMRLAEALEHPQQDRLEARVEGLEPGPGGRVCVHAGRVGSLEAEGVVLAVPAGPAAAAASELLSAPERELLGRGRTAAAIVLCAALEGRVAEEATRIRVPPDEGWPLASVTFEPGGSRASGCRAPEGSTLAVLVASDAWSRAHLEASDEAVEQVLLGFLERLRPGAAAALRFTTLRRTRHALPRFDVGRYREIRQLRKVERDRRAQGRRLYLAGDHLVAPNLDGAVASGRRAAEALLADLGC